MALDKIKKRINVVRTTSKITNAMKLMASGKLQKQTQHLLHIKDYYIKYYKLISSLIDSEPISCNSTKTLHIVVTSYLGLCGGYNMNIIKEAKTKIRSNDFVLQIGKRGHELLMEGLQPSQLIDYDMPVTNFVEYDECESLAYYLLALLESQKIDSITLHYTKFINAICFETMSISLFPFDEQFIKNNMKKINLDQTDFEPNLPTILNDLKLSYLSTIIYASLLETNIVENASRRNAMDSATENAKDLNAKLMLKYNRERQFKITSEIIEIISGSDTKE